MKCVWVTGTLPKGLCNPNNKGSAFYLFPPLMFRPSQYGRWNGRIGCDRTECHVV
jgi:hypothetical protein